MTFKILFIADGITPFTLGGMQRHSANLVSSLIREDVKVTLGFTVNWNEEKPRKEEVFEALRITDDVKSNFEFEVFKFVKGRGLPGHYVRNSLKMSKEIYDFYKDRFDDFDIIYCKGFLGNEFVQKRKIREINIPVAVNLHGYEMFQQAPSIKINVQQVLLLRRPVRDIIMNADFVISYGAKITELLKNLGVSKILELPSGVADEWIVSKEKETIDETIKLVYLGRFERRKGVQEIHNAINQHNASLKKKLEFHFIGPIPDDVKIKESNVVYHGAIRDAVILKGLLDQMDVLLCPSYSEGMPNVILEAMSRGLGVIATDVGAVPLMVDAENGVILSAPPTVKSLVDTFESLNKVQVNEMKKGSLKKIQKFKWSEVAKLTVSVMKEALSESI